MLLICCWIVNIWILLLFELFFDKLLDATVLSISLSCIWLLWPPLCQFKQWIMDNGLFCILHFLLIYESSVILILICFNITAAAQFFPYNAWCDLSSTLGSSHPWWSVVEFFMNCWNSFSAQISFFWLLQYSLQSISFQSPKKTST